MTSTSNLVLINTNFGPFTIELHPEQAPVTVANFLQYVDRDFYDGTIFHRVMDQFMVQGGGMDLNLQFKPPNTPIVLESNNGLQNDRGTVAMARSNLPNSATSQFFVNTVDNPGLNYQANNPGYAVFATVVDGMEVVDTISDIPVASVRISGAPHYHFPYPTSVIIFSADRYTPAANLQPTTHTPQVNDYGVTIASYSGSRYEYGIIAESVGARVVRIDGLHQEETLTSIERLEFSDQKLALDLAPTENAGQAALFIGALAFDLLDSPEVVTTIMGLFDQGKDLKEISQLAIDVGLTETLAGSRSNDDLAKLLFRNVVGGEASDDMANNLAANIQGSGGTLSQAEFIAAVSLLELNQQHIGLIGLQHTGLEYA